ncbi:hypothetical protein [Hydrogenothermus marinus]|uniref:Uncharacterized protein n=1 Tax=Hydrogenothermus marinus TaxID=133270 RepID=A0A3M0B7C2_9AQUI|nr:hypothetical protein [Hydrogenothermus marinus]RMA92536.1 hypothetical protein CLV39_1584 [Hydrogenothermus marinus]
MKRSFYILNLLIILLISNSIYAKHIKCKWQEGIGEASIIKDYSSAKMEACARAKWDALEKALGTQINVKSVIENFKLLDEVITKDVKGFITDVKIIKEENLGDAVRVTIKGCVYPQKAEKALSLISRNTMFNVIFIVQDRNNIELDDMNPVNVELINTLTQQGFEVYDFASDPDINPYEIENIISQRRFISLRRLLTRSLAKITIIGKIRFIYRTKAGQNIGYELYSPFNIILAQAQYYLLMKDKGRIRILSSGNVSAKGISSIDEYAKNKALESLAPKLADDILNKIQRYMISKRKFIIVYVKDIKSVSKNFEIKSNLQKLPWVKSVEDLGIGKFRVEYLENPIYLANALESIYGYKILTFSPTRIIINLN